MPEPDDLCHLSINSLGVAEEHFRDLVAAVDDYAIVLLTPDGEIATWNRGAERINGYTAAEIIGRHLSSLYSAEAVKSGTPQHDLEMAAKTGKLVEEGWRARADGSPFWASVTITTLRAKDGRIRGFLQIIRDLTDLKQASERLRQSEERFHLLVEGVQDYAIFMLDPRGRVASWNKGAARMTGYRASEILGRHFSCFYPPEWIAQDKPGWELQQALEHGRVEDEGWRVRRDNTRFWANTIITALYDQQGTLQGFAKITRDMTDRRNIEALLEADRQKNEFLALLAHELRNPLAPIRNAVHVLGQPNLGPVQGERARAMAERQIEQMGRLLDDLLDLARLSRGRLELRLERVDLRAAIGHALETTQTLLQERQHDVTVTAGSTPLWVNADPTRLEQILVNLLSNAAKYTNPRGRIWITAEARADAAIVRVKDSGIGIEAPMLPLIFNLFVQAERRTTRSVGGIGIGLTLVRQLVVLHGGTVEAFSAGLGKGSEFVVRLPPIAAEEAVPSV
ncbi:MAG: PAS domain-containing sensor histidine kinase [Verrucomicrobia bacterium]|nr:PAS domain-containing sensor histidine kinase [Verrucomicrobiota bacterium]